MTGAPNEGEAEAGERGDEVSFRKHLSLLVAGILGAVGIAAPQATAPTKDAPVLKIAVFADGGLTADGAISSIEKLKESLKTLAEHRGVVWYYRESAQQNPPLIAMDVLKEVVALRLPVRLSSKPDYSDAVGPVVPK